MEFPKVKGYVTHAYFEARELIHLVGKNRPALQVLWNWRIIEVSVSSNRLELFKRSQICVSCGCVGTVFLLQTFNRDSGAPHLNLYSVGVSGHYRLMTQDHIIPRARGGGNSLDNLQTMCRKCNQKKGCGFDFSEIGS